MTNNQKKTVSGIGHLKKTSFSKFLLKLYSHVLEPMISKNFKFFFNYFECI